MPGRICLGKEGEGYGARIKRLGTQLGRRIEGDGRVQRHSGAVHATPPICAMRRNPVQPGFKKNEQGSGPCSENCVDPLFPASSDLIFFGGVTLLLRARAPPETWTTRLPNVGLRPNS
jgi:hypothetical protein